MSDLTTPRARRKRKGRADGQDGPSIDPTSQQDDDDDDDVRDVRDEVRHATTKKYFRVRYVSHQTSLRRLSLARRPKMGRMVRRWNAPSGFFSTAQSDPNDVAMPAFVQPRTASSRLVVSSRGKISNDLIVDASASIARRRTPNAGTLSTDSLILPFFAFSLDAALSPPGRPTVKVRRTRAHFRNASHTIRRKTAHRVRFPRARSRGRGRDSTGGIVDVHRDGWARRRPLSLLMDGWGCRM